MSYEFRSTLKDQDLKKFPIGIIDQFRFWIETIKKEGLEATRKNKRYKDHILKGR